MSRTSPGLSLLPYLAAAFALCMTAARADSLGDALRDGKVSLDARYRLEFVQQDGIAQDAAASTLRTRLDYQTGTLDDFSALLGFQDTRVVGNTLYNDTDNGKTQYPVVADPSDTELDQFYLAYAPLDTLRIAGGRQAILLDNQRFVGNVGFRQLEQTFDGLTAKWTATQDVDLFYAYLTRVHRVFGDHNTDPTRAPYDLSTHLFNASWTLPVGKLTGYAYLIGNDANPAASHKDLGLRYTGSHGSADDWRFFYTLEGAHQNPYRDGAANISANYADLEGGFEHAGWKAWLGQERLGGNGTYAFQTPLATLHAFNGWADRFPTTPPGGLRDTYLGGAKSALLGGELNAVYHDFHADTGGGRYGRELDLRYAHPLGDTFSAALELADYRADSFATDTRITWFTVQMKL